MKKAGIYIHIPFCKGKCPYCDFYSLSASEENMDGYLSALLKEIERKSREYSFSADTVYIGGGTPSVFGGERIGEILEKLRGCFPLAENAEITAECNPSSSDFQLFKALSKAGVNRISMGMQSAVDKERKALGRKADKADVSERVKEAKEAGIENISLDLMLGTPFQTLESLKESLNFLVNSGASHISGYMLKIEEGTPFYKMGDKLSLPGEDAVSDMYLLMCDYLEKAGFHQYEVSNFALKDKESRHNTKYWRCEEYLGLGPSAHSFMNGKRFFYPRDINAFISSPETVDDGKGGDFEEYAMLALRLSEGLREDLTGERFGVNIPKEVYEKAAVFERHGLLKITEKGISLTSKGFLLSNSIISELIL